MDAAAEIERIIANVVDLVDARRSLHEEKLTKKNPGGWLYAVRQFIADEARVLFAGNPRLDAGQIAELIHPTSAASPPSASWSTDCVWCEHGWIELDDGSVKRCSHTIGEVA